MAAKKADKWAILIGVNRYHESLGPLKYAVHDCRRVGEVLTQGEDGFPADHVLLITDDQPEDRRPTYANIHSWLASWLSQPKENDTVFVYFSGHGRDMAGKCYLAPGDATLQTMHVTGIPVAHVQDILARCKAKQKILVLDACHSGAGKDVAAMSGSMLDQIAAGKGIYTITSCDADELSHEWNEKKQGVFSYYLAEALSGACPPDAQGRVTAESLYEWVYDRVRSWAARKRCTQTPKRFAEGTGAVTLKTCPNSTVQADSGNLTADQGVVVEPASDLIDPAAAALRLRLPNLHWERLAGIPRVRKKDKPRKDADDRTLCEICGSFAGWGSDASPGSRQCPFCGRWVIKSWMRKVGWFRRERKPHECWNADIGCCKACADVLNAGSAPRWDVVGRIKRFHACDEAHKDADDKKVCERCGAWAGWASESKPLHVQCPYCGRWIIHVWTYKGERRETGCWNEGMACCSDCATLLTVAEKNE